MVRRKVTEVLDRSGLSPRGHSGKDLLQILETYPRDELFQIKTDDLYEAVDRRAADGRPPAAAAVPAPRRVRPVHLLPDLPAPGPVHHRQPAAHAGDPAARAERHRRRLHHPGHRVGCWPGCTSSCAPTRPTRPAQVDPNALAELLADATRMWDDDFSLVLERKLGEEPAKRPVHPVRRRATRTATRTGTRRTRRCRTSPSWSCSRSPASWRCTCSASGTPARAAQPEPDDARRPVQGLPVRRADDALRRAAGAALARRPGRRRAAVRDPPRPTAPSTCTTSACSRRPAHRELAEVRPQVENAFAAAWRGEAEVDGFNELVLRAGLTWRQVVVLRAYAKYLRQAGSVFSQRYLESTFIAYPEIARLLVHALRDPVLAAAGGRRAASAAGSPASWSTQITALLDEVDSLDQDRILRSYLTLIQATLRTSFFQRGAGRPAQVRTWPSSSTRRPSPTCRSPARSTRSSCTRRGSRACTCASARSPGAACAGPTGGRTSAPRCSAWSRRRW